MGLLEVLWPRGGSLATTAKLAVELSSNKVSHNTKFQNTVALDHFLEKKKVALPIQMKQIEKGRWLSGTSPLLLPWSIQLGNNMRFARIAIPSAAFQHVLANQTLLILQLVPQVPCSKRVCFNDKFLFSLFCNLNLSCILWNSMKSSVKFLCRLCKCMLSPSLLLLLFNEASCDELLQTEAECN